MLYFNSPAVREALGVVSQGPPRWEPCSDVLIYRLDTAAMQPWHLDLQEMGESYHQCFVFCGYSGFRGFLVWFWTVFRVIQATCDHSRRRNLSLRRFSAISDKVIPLKGFF